MKTFLFIVLCLAILDFAGVVLGFLLVMGFSIVRTLWAIG